MNYNIVISVPDIYINSEKQQEIIDKSKEQNICLYITEKIKKVLDLSVAELQPDYVFSLAYDCKNFIIVDGMAIHFKVGSNRIKTFKKNIKCVNCGIEGKVFRLEKSSKNCTGYHLNLYAIQDDGTYILMTKDHIIPRSKKGTNKLSNLQTMCCVCNNLKSNKTEFSINEEEQKEYLQKRKESFKIINFLFSFEVDEKDKNYIESKKKFVISLFNSIRISDKKYFYSEEKDKAKYVFNKINNYEIVEEYEKLTEMDLDYLNKKYESLFLTEQDKKYFELANKEKKCNCCGLEINRFAICNYKNNSKNNYKFKCLNKKDDKYVSFHLDFKNYKVKHKRFLPFYNCSLCNFIKAGKEISKENFTKVLEYYNINKDTPDVFKRCSDLIEHLNNTCKKVGKIIK